jgi:hypothetical protein
MNSNICTLRFEYDFVNIKSKKIWKIQCKQTAAICLSLKAFRSSISRPYWCTISLSINCIVIDCLEILLPRMFDLNKISLFSDFSIKRPALNKF